MAAREKIWLLISSLITFQSKNEQRKKRGKENNVTHPGVNVVFRCFILLKWQERVVCVWVAALLSSASAHKNASREHYCHSGRLLFFLPHVLLHVNVFFQLAGSWKLLDAHLSPALQFHFYLLSFRAPDDFAVATARPNLPSWMQALCEAELDGVGHWARTSMLVNHSLASQPTTSTMLLLTAIQLRKRKKEKKKKAPRHQLAARSRSRVRMAMGLASAFLPSCYTMQTARSVLHSGRFLPLCVWHAAYVN